MTLIYTPDGGAINTERQEVHWPVEFMRMLAIFADNCGDGGLSIQCERCHQPLQGHNAKSDNFWRMECQCRTYIGRNPWPRATRDAAEHRH